MRSQQTTPKLSTNVQSNQALRRAAAAPEGRTVKRAQFPSCIMSAIPVVQRIDVIDLYSV